LKLFFVAICATNAVDLSLSRINYKITHFSFKCAQESNLMSGSVCKA